MHSKGLLVASKREWKLPDWLIESRRFHDTTLFRILGEVEMQFSELLEKSRLVDGIGSDQRRLNQILGA